MLSGQVGLLLGFLARKVLGQYDISLLGHEPLQAGKLYFVEPNIRMLENTLRVPADDLRTWIAPARGDPCPRVRGQPVGARLPERPA